ncbi:uncharacterized protein LOC126682690 [Mercurialis annua]|uniref:uncharacterized protein LOC126682690 n=1 Tax=Mercurialis annua TaxID=3986 RepID=UPI0021607E15|nr:uncharacterized protein LOC126682690 [Mercurialis annua]
MGPNYVQIFILIVLCASMLRVGVANRNPQHGDHRRLTNIDPQKIVVGGSTWTYGFDYTNWAIEHNQFYVNDSLVFKYDLPKDSTTHPYSVYLLPDQTSFATCNLAKAVKVADESQGGGPGFEFVLKEYKPYWFASGGGEGINCNLGKMKFKVLPLPNSAVY